MKTQTNKSLRTVRYNIPLIACDGNQILINQNYLFHRGISVYPESNRDILSKEQHIPTEKTLVAFNEVAVKDNASTQIALLFGTDADTIYLTQYQIYVCCCEDNWYIRNKKYDNLFFFKVENEKFAALVSADHGEPYTKFFEGCWRDGKWCPSGELHEHFKGLRIKIFPFNDVVSNYTNRIVLAVTPFKGVVY
jgi:hypothetical protein